ncbi:MAG: CoA transferase [Deltaproteobacteria bacterium]|nr:CoA transferase [Deltaproteobacteria bacterium]MBW2308957.1 CoA transferase [Deltaproteobacteria bacterium]
MPGPLKGYRVLSFGRVLAGPYAAMLLCDMGAEVIKVEEPTKGDPARNNGPFINGISSYFFSVNRGKKSITLNLRHEEGKEIARRLIRSVDVLIENFRPGVMDRLGLGYHAVREINPRLVFASISGFGQTGPYAHRPAYDMVAQGMGGTVSITGEPGRPPVRVGYSIGDMGAALFASNAILAALLERERSGQGQWIDVAMVDSQVALCENALARYFANGQVPRPLGSRHPLNTPFQVFPARDGYIVLIASQEADWERFCRLVNRPDLLEDHRFRTREGRTQNHAELEPILVEILRSRTAAQWLHDMEAAGIICSPVNDIQQVVEDQQIRSRGMIAEVQHPKLGSVKVAGTPFKLSRTSCSIEKGAPDLGQHTEDILKGLLGATQEEIKRLREKGVV